MNEVEPWLRGTHAEISAIPRQLLHALELAAEDATRWCAHLTTEQVHARPYSLPSVAFHLRHIARSLDRLLTYAEARALSEAQLAALHSEMDPSHLANAVLQEFHTGLQIAIARILAVDPTTYNAPRTVGRAHLPTTIGGLLVHCAEHTQRHAGQFVTTAKIVSAIQAEHPL